MEVLSVNEEVLLYAIMSKNEDAYGFTILKEVMEITGKKVVYGTLYNSLDNLVRKGFITVHKGEPTAERGGKRKVYYKITKLGKENLIKTKKFHESLLERMSNLAYE